MKLTIVKFLWLLASAGSNVHVTVTGFRNGNGDCLLALFSSKDGYPMDASKAIRKLKASIVNGEATFDLPDLPEGTYALSILHDENHNGKMDRNLVGAPKEGYGASNNPKMPLFGPPTFEAAAFKATAGSMTVQVPLHYIKY